MIAAGASARFGRVATDCSTSVSRADCSCASGRRRQRPTRVRIARRASTSATRGRCLLRRLPRSEPHTSRTMWTIIASSWPALRIAPAGRRVPRGNGPAAHGVKSTALSLPHVRGQRWRPTRPEACCCSAATTMLARTPVTVGATHHANGERSPVQAQERAQMLRWPSISIIIAPSSGAALRVPTAPSGAGTGTSGRRSTSTVRLHCATRHWPTTSPRARSCSQVDAIARGVRHARPGAGMARDGLHSLQCHLRRSTAPSIRRHVTTCCSSPSTLRHGGARGSCTALGGRAFRNGLRHWRMQLVRSIRWASASCSSGARRARRRPAPISSCDERFGAVVCSTVASSSGGSS